MPVIVPEYELLHDVSSFLIVLRKHDQDVEESEFDEQIFVLSACLSDSLNFDYFIDFVNDTFDVIWYKFLYPKKDKLILLVSVYE